MSFCTHCGAPFVDAAAKQLTCSKCAAVTYRNPVPVVVLLVPVLIHTPVPYGLLVIERGEEPAAGQFALPGGFLEAETWQEGAVRELAEEVGLIVDPRTVTEFGLRSAQNRLLLAFGIIPAIRPEDLAVFKPNAEVRSYKVIEQAENIQLAFSTHTEMARKFFAKQP